MLARRARAGRRDLRGDAHLDVRPRVGNELEARIAQLEPVRLVRDRLAAHQRHEHADRLVHAVALLLHVDAHHEGVGGQRARPHPEHHAAARHVVELHDAIGEHQRVVIRERGDAGAEADVPRALGGGGDEDLGRGDDLVAGAVVLADPGLVVAELVEVLDQLHVAL